MVGAGLVIAAAMGLAEMVSGAVFSGNADQPRTTRTLAGSQHSAGCAQEEYWGVEFRNASMC
jgi:hypothetical protein